MRFEPEGITQNPEIPFAKSMPDYIMRWLASRFLDTDIQEELGIMTPEVRARKMAEDVGHVDALLRHRRARRTANGGGNGGAQPPSRAGPPARTAPARSPRRPARPPRR